MYSDIVSQSTRSRSAFSLIEAAIVLGIIGLVLGGIWVAASSVNENRKLSRALEQSIVLLSGARTLMKSEPDITDPAVQNDLSEVLLKAGIAPADMAYDGSSVNVRGYSVDTWLKNPWNGPMSVYHMLAPSGINQGNVQTYTLSFWDVPLTACRRLFPALTGRYSWLDSREFLGIFVRGGGTTAWYGNQSAAPTVSSICFTDDGSGRMVLMSFFFRRTY